jgi:Ca2+/H+ antiporter, TMEM165/GDT1 family
MSLMSQAFSLMFLVELGDKTQFVVLALATQYPAPTVLAGAAGATLLMELAAALAGARVGTTLPGAWGQLLAGGMFVSMGLAAFRGAALGSQVGETEPRWGPWLTVGLAVGLAELGDKTMLATMALAQTVQGWPAIWLGGTMGILAVDGLTIAARVALRPRLPGPVLTRGAGIIWGMTGVALLTMPLPR